ncbi:hypothetical protein, partial [Burkholderia vietnamiensis]
MLSAQGRAFLLVTFLWKTKKSDRRPAQGRRQQTACKTGSTTVRGAPTKTKNARPREPLFSSKNDATEIREQRAEIRIEPRGF